MEIVLGMAVLAVVALGLLWALLRDRKRESDWDKTLLAQTKAIENRTLEFVRDTLKIFHTYTDKSREQMEKIQSAAIKAQRELVAAQGREFYHPATEGVEMTGPDEQEYPGA